MTQILHRLILLPPNVGKGARGHSRLANKPDPNLVQDVLHSQSPIPILALGYDEILEDSSFLLSSQRLPVLNKNAQLTPHLTHADVSICSLHVCISRP